MKERLIRRSLIPLIRIHYDDLTRKETLDQLMELLKARREYR